MRRLKLITFDLDNTLWPVEEVILRAERASSQYLQQRFSELVEQLSVEALHRTRDQLVQNQSHYWKNLTRLRIDTLSQTLTQNGIAQQEANQAAQAAFDVFYHERNQVTFFPGALKVLETLADSYMLGALSNGNANLELIGIHDLFEFHHSAESVGEAKPAAAIFLAALSSAGVTARDALHVGDHPSEDIDGARRAGFATIWANLTDQTWPADLAAPAWCIRHLHELTDLVPLLDD